MTSLSATDAELRRDLVRHKRFALGLLVAMGALIAVGHSMPPGFYADLVQACAKAGFVGGLADWFAVTALFRHPLGIPIPHTAIIPTQKARLGRALGSFVAGHVITAAEVSRVLGRLDVSAILARFLTNRTAARPCRPGAGRDAAPHPGHNRGWPRPGAPWPASPPACSAAPAAAPWWPGHSAPSSTATATTRCWRFLLTELRDVIDGKHGQLHDFIQEKVRAQGGRLVGWVIGAQVADRVLGVLRAEIDRVDQEGSSIREAFDHWVRHELDRMETDPERAAEIGRAIRRVVAHETVQAWLWDVWARLRLALEADAARPNGRTIAVIEGALANLGSFLAEDQGARTRLQGAAESIIATLLPSAQDQLSGFIADVVAAWDPKTITEKIELRVGKDLQYVRINGTVVGALAGGVLFLLLRAVYGPTGG